MVFIIYNNNELTINYWLTIAFDFIQSDSHMNYIAIIYYILLQKIADFKTSSLAKLAPSCSSTADVAALQATFNSLTSRMTGYNLVFKF